MRIQSFLRANIGRSHFLDYLIEVQSVMKKDSLEKMITNLIGYIIRSY